MNKFEHLICPVCHSCLSSKQTFTEPQSLVCSNLHSFDVSRKGYVNLLLTQDKNSKDPGDNKEMAKARKRFLDKGYYEPLAKGLCTLFSQKLSSMDNKSVLLDAGCGDGYYTDSIKRFISEKSLSFSVYGMDISKEAIRLASGRNKDIGFLVASLFRIPFESNSADFILNAFAPSSDSEFCRIMKDEGLLVTVIPGKNHLNGLKSVLYENPYENDEKEPELLSFKCEDQVRINDTIRIGSQEDIADLLTMTPYYWKTSKEGVERLKKLASLETQIEFIINIHSKLLV